MFQGILNFPGGAECPRVCKVSREVQNLLEGQNFPENTENRNTNCIYASVRMIRESNKISALEHVLFIMSTVAMAYFSC